MVERPQEGENIRQRSQSRTRRGGARGVAGESYKYEIPSHDMAPLAFARYKFTYTPKLPENTSILLLRDLF